MNFHSSDAKPDAPASFRDRARNALAFMALVTGFVLTLVWTGILARVVISMAIDAF